MTILRGVCQPSNMSRCKAILIANTVLLFVNIFVVIVQLNRNQWPSESYFTYILSAQDRDALIETTRVFVSALDAANVTSYFLYGGSLIGSYRHHGPIPWDDDVDVIADARDKSRVFDALSRLAPSYALHVYGSTADQYQWKFYYNGTGARSYFHRPYKWPYVDMFFFEQNETHIWDEVPMYSQLFSWPKSVVFPLQRRPFGLGLSVPAPCDTGNFLAKNYELERCRTRDHNHQLELPMLGLNFKDLPCERLYNLFPFVRSRTASRDVTTSDDDVVETLSIAEWDVSSVRLKGVASCGK